MSLEEVQLSEVYSNENVLAYLADVDLRLSGHISGDVALDHASLLAKLDGLLKTMISLETERTAKLKAASGNSVNESATTESDEAISLNAVKLLSSIIGTVLEKLPSKIYDLANTLLGEISVDEDLHLTASGQIACLVLIDILDKHPLHVASLINYAATQIYKILKKNPIANSSLVYLLGSVVRASLKSDIDEKFLAKLVKLVLKTLTQHSIILGGSPDISISESREGPSIAMAVNYVQVLKGLLVLQISSNYQSLLEISASSTSGSKLKPEAIMAQQNLFQQAILASHEKVFVFCLQSQFAEVRSAMVDLLAGLFINFVNTGKFNATDYLLGIYPKPDLNLWDESLSFKVGVDADFLFESRTEKNLLSTRDSESISNSNLNTLLLQIGVVETFVFYIQLELLQDKDFLSSSLTKILDSILLKFDDLNNVSHVQNAMWVRVLSQWSKVVEFLINESGSLSHDMLARYVMQHFSSSQEDTSRADSPDPKTTTKEKKRESILFGFKGLKKNKKKGSDRGQINLYTNPYQLKLLLEIVSALLPYGVDFNSLIQSPSKENLLDGADDIDDIDLVDEDENKSTTQRNSYISDLLLSLLANESEYIRNYSLVCLLDYARVNQSESNRLSLEIFSLLSQEFNNQNSQEAPASPTERNITKSSTTKLFSYSLALLALLKEADFTLLQNSTVAKLLSFCTQNLKHNSSIGLKNIKNGACWIVLSALVTFYDESEFVKLNSSQFLVFWKNLLTSQYVSSTLSGESALGGLEEILQNLKLRSFSILCLLNYISTIEVTPELLKQLQFLLIKSHKYLVHLESNFEELGMVTAFNPQAFNESDYNPNLVNGIIFSNHFDSSKLSIDNQLVSMILYNKKLVMQGFIKIAHSLKGDVNSGLVVLLIKIFADAKLFSRLSPSEYNKDKGKAKQTKQTISKVTHQDHDILFLEEEYNYNFGVTSKFQSSTPNIDELCCKDESSTVVSPKFQYNRPLDFEQISYPKSAIESSFTYEVSNWTDTFERMQYSSSSHSVNFDPAILMLHNYSLRHAYSTTLITSLIDLSIELFQLVFPGLSYKIQFSLLEQLRSSLIAKQVDPLRSKALAINVSVAIHGLLNNLVKKKVSLNEELVSLIIETLDAIDTTNVALVSLCSHLVGLAAKLLPLANLEDLITTKVGKIVNDTSPYHRGRYILSLAQINNFTHSGFLEINDVITQLLKDSHPVISFYTLTAASIIHANALGNQNLIEELLSSTYAYLFSNSFGTADSTDVYADLRLKYGLVETVGKLVNVCVTSLGPLIRECSTSIKSKVFQILLLLSHGIGCSSMRELLSSIPLILTICQQLIIFDPSLTLGFAEWFRGVCIYIAQTNLKTGIGLIRPTSINLDSIFPFTTSQDLFQFALNSLVEMTKVGLPTLSKDALSLAWTLMELRPCSQLETLISYWTDTSSEAQWFHQLTQLFNMSSRKLVGKFLEINYQQKLLPLQQRQKKTNKDVNVIFADEEAQNIVEVEGEVDDKYQPINWAFRLLIYDLLVKFLSDAEKNTHLLTSLEPKIQEIVRIAFLGTTSPILFIKIKGVDLLDKALEVFGHLEDPLYPGVSILEQQQAQIISALIPCFSSDSDAIVIVEAIDVSSKFINLPRINFYSKHRILNTMIYLLEEISSNKFLKFVHLESMAEYGRKAIQLAILNCWAVLNVNFTGSDGVMEPEFDVILKKYSKLLISLWILVLKELSNLKYNQPNSKELKLYGEYWLNFVGVLSLILEKDPTVVKEFLQEEEENFFFVMFCQCSESLIKNQNVSQVLVSVNRLVKIPDLAKTLFCDDVFGEVIDLLDRLIIMEEEIETKCKVVDTVKILFETISIDTTLSENSVAKFFELLRVAMLPLFEIFPFLRQDFNPEDQANILLLKKCNSQSIIAMANKQFSVLAQMTQGFPENKRADLISCMLYLIAKFFEFQDDELISTVLPFLKTIVAQARGMDTDLLGPFVKILKANGLFEYKLSKKNTMITIVILITGGDIHLNEEEATRFAKFLLEVLSDKSIASTSIQSIKSIINNTKQSGQTTAKITRLILGPILDSLVEDKETEEVDIKIKFEIVFLFTQSLLMDTDEKATAFFGLLIPLLINYDEKNLLGKEYLHDKMMHLMNNRSNSFKEVIREQLDATQRKVAENLVKYSNQDDNDYENGGIQLKSFA